MKTYGVLRRVTQVEDTVGWDTRLDIPVMGMVDLKRPVWELECAPYVVTKVKRLLTRANSDRRGVVSIADTPETSRELAWIMDRWPMEMAPEDRAQLERQRDEHIRREQVVTSVLAGSAPPLRFSVEPTGTPYGYQEDAARILWENRRLLLTDELGLGKTLSALLLLRHPEALPMVVVAPAHLPGQWMREMARWFPTIAGHIARTTQVYNPAEHRSMRGVTPDVLFVTYAKLHGWADELAGIARSLILEEAQELRVPGSQKYTAAAYLAGSVEWCMGITGTPVYNYGDEIHSVLDVIAPDALGTRSEFIREWCTYGGRKARVADPRALGSYLREQGVMLRRTRKDVGKELPPVVHITQPVDCDAEVLEDAGAAVEQMADMLLSGQGKPVDRRDAAKELDWRLRQATGVAKAPHVATAVRLILEAEDKMVLFGWHREVYDIWMEMLSDFQPAMYTGSESLRQKELSVARFIGGERLQRFTEEDRKAGRLKSWQEHTETRLMFMSLRSGSGVDDLQHVCHVVGFGELDWAPGVHTQDIGRVDRPGQDQPVVAITFLADDGSDPVVQEVQTEKRQQAELINDPDSVLFSSTVSDDRMMQLARYAKDKLGKRRR